MKTSGHNSNKKNPVSAPPAGRLPDAVGIAIFVLLVISGTALDLWSKKAVFDWLGPVSSGKEYSLIDGFLRFVARENSGAAFSIAQGQRTFLVGISVIALIFVLILFFAGRIHHRLMQTALGCITAGIIGNLYDRAFNDGLVRDFIDVYVGQWHWPTFNVADSLLCIGVGLVVIHSFTSGADQTPDLPQTKES